MTENGTDWRLVAAEEARQRNKAEEALVEMRRFLFDYFHLLGPDPLENINVVVRTLGKVLGSDVALYNRLENGILKTWSIDNEPPGFKRETALPMNSSMFSSSLLTAMRSAWKVLVAA